MASSFWKGFANTLNTSLTKQRDREAESTEWERRKKMEMELEKKYGAEVVARTAVEGNEEVSYNKYGDIIRRRVLTAEELKLRQAEVDSTLAGARKATADATVSEFNATVAPEKWELDKTVTNEQILNARSSRANDSARVGIDRERLALDRQANAGLPKAVADTVYETVEMISDLPPNGVTSPELEAETYLKAVDAAAEAGNIPEVRRITHQIRGQIASRLRQRKTQDTTRGSSFIQGLSTPPPPKTPGEY